MYLCVITDQVTVVPQWFDVLIPWWLYVFTQCLRFKFSLLRGFDLKSLWGVVIKTNALKILRNCCSLVSVLIEWIIKICAQFDTSTETRPQCELCIVVSEGSWFGKLRVYWDHTCFGKRDLVSYSQGIVRHTGRPRFSDIECLGIYAITNRSCKRRLPSNISRLLSPAAYLHRGWP